MAVPRHVAIIMDGNGRWAKSRGLPRAEGHRRGVEAVRRTVRAAIDLGIPHLTIFSFSSENWSRPITEIDDLMGLMKRFIRRDLAELHQNGVRIRVIGATDRVDSELLSLIDEARALTVVKDAVEKCKTAADSQACINQAVQTGIMSLAGGTGGTVAEVTPGATEGWADRSATYSRYCATRAW